jgi:hypothetical protein
VSVLLERRGALATLDPTGTPFTTPVGAVVREFARIAWATACDSALLTLPDTTATGGEVLDDAVTDPSLMDPSGAAVALVETGPDDAGAACPSTRP